MSNEQHRHDCEVRFVLSLPFAERRPYLELVGKRRGQAARDALEADMIRQHKTRRKAA